MDQSVLNAIERWPDVPAVYGWLSLSARGDWRLHPLGDGNQGGSGTGITSPQILSFIGRNYASETNGAWFFQNGPQRVYVRLDAAPYVLHVMPASGEIVTQNGLTVQRVRAWFVDDTGQLYAQTELGAARLDDRDLQTIAETLCAPDGRSLLEVLEDPTQASAHAPVELRGSQPHYAALKTRVPLERVAQADIPARLGFIAHPHHSDAAA